jgi:hypothetical protein
MWDPETNKDSRTSSVAWAKHSLVEALSAIAPLSTPNTAFQITIPPSTIEPSPPQIPEQDPMQHELLQPYLGVQGLVLPKRITYRSLAKVKASMASKNSLKTTRSRSLARHRKRRLATSTSLRTSMTALSYKARVRASRRLQQPD